MSNLPNDDTAGMSYAEQMVQLAFLRREFPDWAFEAREERPAWRTQRNYVSYAGRPAAVTEVRANDPDELAALLMRVLRVEVDAGEGVEGER